MGMWMGSREPRQAALGDNSMGENRSLLCIR